MMASVAEASRSCHVAVAPSTAPYMRPARQYGKLATGTSELFSMDRMKTKIEAGKWRESNVLSMVSVMNEYFVSEMF